MSAEPSKLKSVLGDIWSVAKNTTENIKAFVTGAGDAVVRNNTFNLINPQPTPDHQTTYYIGKTAGDAITGIQGMIEGTLGSVGEVGGFVLDSTGGGLFAGLTLNAVSGLAISHAGAVLTTSNKNFGNDFGAIFHSNGSGSSEGTVNGLPDKTIGSNKNGKIEHYYGSGDHGPPHVHVIDKKGNVTRVGQNGKPLKGDPELNKDQSQLVNQFKKDIRKSVSKIMKWFKLN